MEREERGRDRTKNGEKILGQSFSSRFTLYRKLPYHRYFADIGYDGKQTAHGLRGLARTYLAEQGITHEHAEACLAHKTGGNVSLAYNHSTYLEQRKSIKECYLRAKMAIDT